MSATKWMGFFLNESIWKDFKLFWIFSLQIWGKNYKKKLNKFGVHTKTLLFYIRGGGGQSVADMQEVIVF